MKNNMRWEVMSSIQKEDSRRQEEARRRELEGLDGDWVEVEECKDLSEWWNQDGHCRELTATSR